MCSMCARPVWSKKPTSFRNAFSKITCFKRLVAISTARVVSRMYITVAVISVRKTAARMKMRFST